MIMFGSFPPSLWLVCAIKVYSVAWEPTLLWNHYTHNPAHPQSDTNGPAIRSRLPNALLAWLIPRFRPRGCNFGRLYPLSRPQFAGRRELDPLGAPPGHVRLMGGLPDIMSYCTCLD